MPQYIYLCLLSLLFATRLHTIEIQPLINILSTKHPFDYPLAIKIMVGNAADQDVLLCCHGYGSNSSLAEVIKSYNVVAQHLVGFNFPAYNALERTLYQETYGSIHELLPALHILKLLAVNAKIHKISLYGFSAGGGAVINVIGVLNCSDYNHHLKKIGIHQKEKECILAALQRGVIVLDAPIKAGMTPNYRKNKMRPLDGLQRWKGLQLRVALFIQNPDEAIPSHDNDSFVKCLCSCNPLGTNWILIADEGGHCGFHHSLWKAFNKLTEEDP